MKKIKVRRNSDFDNSLTFHKDLSEMLRESLKQDQAKFEKILNYCEPHTDQMWSALIVSIILECDFRDSKHCLEKHRKGMRQDE